jgi:hypothetical protein
MTSPGTLQATITPLETSDGLKAIIMRTGPSTAHVVELREAIGADSRLCDHGALIYTVDATLENGHGIIKLAPAQQGTDPAAVLRCGVLYDGTYDLRPDKRANYSDPRTGIEVQLISERDNSYVVRVTWKKPD